MSLYTLEGTERPRSGKYGRVSLTYREASFSPVETGTEAYYRV